MEADITLIWTDFHKELKAYITKIVKSQTDADDILQEVFIKIIRNSDHINRANNLRQYIYGIVRNAIADHFRKKPDFGKVNPVVVSEEDEQSLNSTIAECCVKPFINKLPEKYKEALLLTELQDVSQKDLAEKLNISYFRCKIKGSARQGKTKGINPGVLCLSK